MSAISLLINKAVSSNVSPTVADTAPASLMRNRSVLSGEDSGFETTWDEFCVQVQGEQTEYWDAYDAAMPDALRADPLHGVPAGAIWTMRRSRKLKHILPHIAHSVPQDERFAHY